MSVFLFWLPLRSLVSFSLQYEHYSHVILIPLVSASLIAWERKRIFSNLQSDVVLGGLLLLAAATSYLVVRRAPISLNENDSLALAIVLLIVLWIGAFVLCYGTHAFRAAAFPLLFLFLMVPIPELFLEKAISVLQNGSAAVAYGLFKLLGVPIYREGFLFTLPGVTIEIAEACSGIRSSMALLVTSILAGHYFLRSGCLKASLILSVFPIALLKNGLRIVVISLLGVYVDAGFLTGGLHRRGGIIFFLLSLTILAVVLRVLQQAENWKRGDDRSVATLNPLRGG